jgi:hypothetical protein
VKLLLDESYPRAIASALREQGHDVIAIQEEPSLRGLPDPALFEVARELGRALVTENVAHFIPLDAQVHARGGSHHGLVLTSYQGKSRRYERFVQDLVPALARLLERYPSDEAGSLVHWL